MRIAYAARARHDLAAVVDFLKARNVHAALVVAATIRKRIALLGRHPLGGRAQDVDGVRRIVTVPFGYVVYYAVDEAAQTVTILSIHRPTGDRRPAEA